jgi:hypothetical protein
MRTASNDVSIRPRARTRSRPPLRTQPTALRAQTPPVRKTAIQDASRRRPHTRTAPLALAFSRVGCRIAARPAEAHVAQQVSTNDRPISALRRLASATTSVARLRRHLRRSPAPPPPSLACAATSVAAATFLALPRPRHHLRRHPLPSRRVASPRLACAASPAPPPPRLRLHGQSAHPVDIALRLGAPRSVHERGHRNHVRSPSSGRHLLARLGLGIALHASVGETSHPASLQTALTLGRGSASTSASRLSPAALTESPPPPMIEASLGRLSPRAAGTLHAKRRCAPAIHLW